MIRKLFSRRQKAVGRRQKPIVIARSPALAGRRSNLVFNFIPKARLLRSLQSLAMTFLSFCLLLTAFCLLFLSFVTFAAEKGEIQLGPKDGKADEKGLPAGWKELTFRKIPNHTKYTVINNDNHWMIRAESRDSASALYKELELDPKKYQILRWRWKIKNTLHQADETTQEGEDYAARIYVTFKYSPDQASAGEQVLYGLGKIIYGKYPPKSSLNYTWANKLPKEHAILSPYSNRVKMIAVESGPALAGQWLTEERNIYEDYKKHFGTEPPPISGIAIMTDTDNTHSEAEAFYAEIVIKTKE